jgi:hypothetical protein
VLRANWWICSEQQTTVSHFQMNYHPHNRNLQRTLYRQRFLISLGWRRKKSVLAAWNLSARRREEHTHRNPIAQRESNALRFTTNPNMTCDRPCLCSLNTQIGQRIFAWKKKMMSLEGTPDKRGLTEKTSSIHVC